MCIIERDWEVGVLSRWGIGLLDKGVEFMVSVRLIVPHTLDLSACWGKGRGGFAGLAKSRFLASIRTAVIPS